MWQVFKEGDRKDGWQAGKRTEAGYRDGRDRIKAAGCDNTGLQTASRSNAQLEEGS